MFTFIFYYPRFTMKHFLITAFLLWLPVAFAQTATVRVLDSVSQQPLELVTVRFTKSGFTVFTDASGNFEHQLQQEQAAEISYVGYETKVVTLGNSAQTILIKPKYEELEGVVIEQQRTYTNSKKIKPALGRPNEYFGFQFGTEHCTYIPNTQRKKGAMGAITLYLEKFPKASDMDYLASYKISFYTYDAATKQPGRELYDKVIIAYPEDKTYRFMVDVEALKIPFPADGVCVGVEIINTRYINPKSTFAYIGPLLGFYEYQLNNNPQSWVRYRNEGWKFKNVIHSNIKHQRSNALMIIADVKM